MDIDRLIAEARRAAEPEPAGRALLDAVAAETGGCPVALGEALEGLRADDSRRGRGLWVTPLALAEAVVAAAPLDGVIVDPSCGAGVFLVAAARRLLAGGATAESLGARLVGLDTDPLAVHAAGLALGALGISAQLRCADATATPWAPEVHTVIGNPPWVDSEGMVRAGLDRAALAARLGLRGNWDLSAAFVALAASTLAPGGHLAFVLPNKIVAAPWGGSVRAVLRQGRVEAVEDHTQRGWFAASVQPIVLRWSRSAPRDHGVLEVGGERSRMPLPERLTDPWPLRPVPDTRGCVALGSLARCTDGATVSEAYALRDALRDGEPGPGDVRVANSGTIDPLTFLWGQRELRYLGRRIARPVIDREALPPRRREQAAAPKLIVASMTRVLEAAVDSDGSWYGAKSTVVVVPTAVPLPWLAVCLCAPTASEWYRAVWGGLALQGGHLRVGSRQLEALPVPPWTGDEAALEAAAAALGQGVEAAARLGERLYVAARAGAGGARW